MRLSEQLFEATYAADRQARMNAYAIFKKVERYIRKQDPNYYDLIDTNTPNGMGLALPIGAGGLPEHVKVVLTPRGNSKMHWLGRSVSPRFVIYLGGVMKGPWNRERLYHRLKMKDDTFVHEYIHAMDFMRGVDRDEGRGRGARGVASAKGDLTDRPALYMRDPAEFNAWYQGIAFGTERNVNTAALTIRSKGFDSAWGQGLVKQYRGWYKSFDAFVRHIEDTADPKTKRNIEALRGSKRWNRKWLKRLHLLYVELKPKVDEMTTPPTSSGRR